MEKFKNIINNLHYIRIKYLKSERQFILILSIFIGIVSGLIAVILKNIVHLFQYLLTFFLDITDYNLIYISYPIIGLFIIYLIYKKFPFFRAKYEVSDIIHFIHRKNVNLPKNNGLYTMMLSAITVSFGGSVGLEGPVAASGASFGNELAKVLKLPRNLAVLVVSCMGAAAISALFKAPITGVVFALEVFLIDLKLYSLIPLLLSSAVAVVFSFLIYGQDIPYKINTIYSIKFVDIFLFIFTGVIVGLMVIYFLEIRKFVRKISKKIKVKYRVLIFGLLIGLLIMFMPSLFGEGYNAINAILNANYSVLFENSPFYSYYNNYLALLIMVFGLMTLKSVATFLTLEAGGVGGMFAPVLFFGACVGAFIYLIFTKFNINVPITVFALVGMAGTVSGAMFAPLTGIFLIVEITGGYDLIIPLMIVSAISYGIVRFKFSESLYLQKLYEEESIKIFEHNKAKNIISDMNIYEYIDKSIPVISPDTSLRQIVSIIKQFSPDIFGVADDNLRFYGVIKVEHLRHIMFEEKFYDTIFARDLFYLPHDIISNTLSMEDVINIFKESNENYFAVVENGILKGFIARSSILTALQKELEKA